MGVQLSHSGTASIGSGVSTLTVSGLGLAWVPTGVTVNVRKPAGSNLNIVATPYGGFTSAGFSVELSSPTDTATYVLDYILWADSTAIDTTGTLQLSYADLCADVSRFLGYPVLASQTAAQIAEVDGYVQAGIRQFYYPPAVAGVEPGYEWSFLRPTTTLTTVASDGIMDMPAAFSRMVGDLHFAASVHARPVMQVSEARIHTLLQASDTEGYPQYAALRYKQSYGSHGQLQEIVLWPVPDAAYVLTYRYEAYNGKLSALNPCPLGGMRHSELILESCLAKAEQRANDEGSLHTTAFRELLAAGVAMDRRGNRNYGQMGSSETFSVERERCRSSDVTYNGVTW